MHPCLKLQEILRIIFEYSLLIGKAGNHDAPNDTSTLAGIARTCRTFQDPALDVLYANLGSIEPLFFCIPNFIVTCKNHYSRRREHVSGRQMTRKDWKFFLRYSSRVCALDVGEDDKRSAFPVRLYQELCSKWDPSNPPFPRLRRLVWQELCQEAFPLLRLLLTPSITGLSIPFAYQLQASIISDLPSLCPNLKKLQFWGSGGKSNPRKDMSDISDHLCADSGRVLKHLVARVSSMKEQRLPLRV
ncbi:hypothetical protein BJ138DRAFT_1015319 [Hygrophoropsis aurantiaca]|uniref:Uncharacterized protein n=1 Tax=Hygrophoropsis aurantiaca TaxID=72124 RepID=A0ACB8A1W5_9AGAM|nr:hypothetical protein BJ138DRAFT_1015319 [Hygrophoropsis aurantiaca]